MALGYDGKLFILAFDHRGSFQKKWFGIEGEPTPEETQKISDSKHDDDFGKHIESFDPDFAKVLVRLNPDGDAEMNSRQLDRLKRLSDWLHENDRKFLFELLVPGEDAQLEQVGGDTDRYD